MDVVRELDAEARLWRLVEDDGRLVTRWLPWEAPVPCVDGGGFGSYRDAQGFALAVILVRCEAGLYGTGITPADIEKARSALDGRRGVHVPSRRNRAAWAAKSAITFPTFGR